MSSNTSSASPSLMRTGARAGMAFALSMLQGAALSLLLGGGAFFYYLSRLHGPGFAGARVGGAGAVLAVLTSPPILVAVVLGAFCIVYLMLGVAWGRRRAMRHLVLAYGATLSQRLAQAIAGHIESRPQVHGALHRAADGLSAEALERQLAPVLGHNRGLSALTGFVLRRLPWQDLLADWQRARAECADLPLTGVAPAQAPVLRTVLERRIGDVLHELTVASHASLYIVLVAHAAVFGVGLWLVR